MRGYFGIGIIDGKTPENMGSLWRSAQAFDADFLFTTGERYPRHRVATDTSDATRHVPYFWYEDFNDLLNNGRPVGADIVGIEMDIEGLGQSLYEFVHPERAVYVLGAEDRGLGAEVFRCDEVVHIPSDFCLNVAMAGTIVMYDRRAKNGAS